MTKTNSSHRLVAVAMCVVFAAAVILAGVMLVRKNQLAAEVQALETTLTETQQAYDALVAEKTVLETEAKALNETLETAQLDLEDATASLEKANGEITQLTEEKTALEKQVAELTTKSETMSASLTEAEKKTAAEALARETADKSVEELTAALEQGVGRIVVDNPTELELLDQLAIAKGVKAAVSFRIKPGIDAHTHAYIRTGQIDSKFGLALETGEAMETLLQASKMAGIEVKGIHCHIGSQIFDVEPFEDAARVMLGFMAEYKAKTGCQLEELDLGGGFGIKYLPEHDPVEYERYMQQVSQVVKDTCAELGLETPFVTRFPAGPFRASRRGR